ncbi:endonuclease domain-containing protein [Pedobacter xixiisoli]|uniref:Very-short-patch-repair endonuclease n=1 Tax=Pedobacter xixiisoli TaxID=1476464 RepID=A0A285ZQF1_9SPHI|nr:endonuclease domain-containing protein [Pedobacter xixiisoli]SOD11883.1 Very-short-patch-repair endonuclease [Pedobacter xixiisoli]
MDAKSFRKELRKNQTSAENSFWNLVRANKFLNLKFRRQHTVDKYTVDFHCPRLNLIIELDGSVHQNLGQSLYDEQRDSCLKAKGYHLIRLDNDAVLNYPEVVLEYLKEIIEEGKLLR